ncbi:ParB/RepB/Spo0J family partition protein [Acidithiobacillus sulfuriphilus]|uniref:ParB/RepB/Spo0J family partition protein n=1 Tax=Acidithiobacillus sulfuriphilus TaxID=1867749 RepID=UPI003F5F9EA9
MAKFDRSKGLFAQMERVLEEIGGSHPARDSHPAVASSSDAAVAETASVDAAASGHATDGGSEPGGFGRGLFLSLADIEPDPDQPRKSFAGDDEGASGLDALKESILAHGVLQPISVRRLESGRYQIIAGERRWRAAAAAHTSGHPCRRNGYDLSRIPAVVLAPASDPDRLEMQLVENLARADMTPIETAQALARLMDCLDPKPSLSELGKRIGRSKAWVHQMLALASPESQQVADYLGLPLEDIGQTDISRMKGWMKDEDKRVVLDAIRASLQAGETLSRVLVDREEERYEQQFRNHTQEEPMQQSGEPVRAFDENGEEVDVSTIDMDGTDSDEDIDDCGTVDEDGVVVGDPADNDPPDDARALDAMPDLVVVTLPRPLLERAFAKAGRELPGTMGTAEIVEALELALNL